MLRIGSNIWPGYEPLYLARRLGLYRGGAIKLVELPSGSEVLHGLRSGELEGAAITLDEALTVIDDGLNLKVILIADFSHGGDALLAHEPMASLAQLRNKRIAVEHTAVGAILLDGALESGGLAVADVELVSCPVDEHELCYQRVDAIVTFEPVKSRLQQQGAHLLFDSSQIAGRIVDVLVVREDVLTSHKRAVQQLLRGYFEARDYLAEHPQQAAEQMVGRLGLNASEVLKAYEGLRLPTLAENRKLLGEGEDSLEQVTSELAIFMRKRRLLKHRLSGVHLLNDDFLPAERL